MSAKNQTVHESSKSEAMQKVWDEIDKVAPTEKTVLITGETGVGKEIIAEKIREQSPRKDKPYKSVNCASFSHDLLHSELFGHEKGSFSGADRQHKGLFEVADGGTVFLDEIAEMSTKVQAIFLRVLNSNPRIFQRLGSSKDIETDVRIIAATNVDVKTAIKKGEFREDLYYRLGTFTIEIPPLRQRREDIPDLVSIFISNHNNSEKKRKGIAGIAPDAVKFLQKNDWPGNVRELKEAVENAIISAIHSSMSSSDSEEPQLQLKDFQIKALKPPRLGTYNNDEKSEDVKAAFYEILKPLKKWKDQEESPLKFVDHDQLWTPKNLECLAIYFLSQQLEWGRAAITDLTKACGVNLNTFNKFKALFEKVDEAERKNVLNRIQEARDPSQNRKAEEKRDTQNSPDTHRTVDGSPAVIAVLEARIAALQSDLKWEREEKAKLLDMLAREQEKTKLLMLPQTEAKPVKKKGS